ncbi:MAG: hypothetical protein H6707_17425 [Deltaproteobacteria bacterium]|nr:hypothetical protein [Deltaproteobacteria bacterium]
MCTHTAPRCGNSDHRPDARSLRLRGVVLLVLTLIASLQFSGCPWAGCSVRDVQTGPPIPANGRWIMLPVVNHSTTPQAGERVEAILSTLLRARGVSELASVPPPKDEEGLPELDDQRLLERAIGWAKRENYVYGVTGSVEEWRYRGIDGQPSAAISLRVMQLDNRRVLWSASGARSGWSRETVAGTAQRLIKELVEQLKLKR